MDKFFNKKTYTKKHSLIIFLALILLYTPILVFGADFDNVISKPATTFDGKDYRDISLLSKYEPIKIDNWFGVGDTLAEAYISEHTESCGIDCHSNIQIKLYKEGSLIDDIRFDNKIRNYQFYIKIGEEEYDTYDYVCSETGKLNVNGTAEIKCGWKLVVKTKPIYEEYVLGTSVPAGTYEIKLEGQKKPSREVDWQIKTNGFWTTDWAVWGIGAFCYQESANVSTACGGLDTGKYFIYGDNQNGEFENVGGNASLYDGDWTTYAYSGLGAYLYINYTVPTNALDTSQWELKMLDAPVTKNFTLGDCWNTNKLQFRIYSNGSTPNGDVNATCFTGTQWLELNSTLSDVAVYEESMAWNISTSTINLNSPVDNYNSTGLTIFNCSATSGAGALLKNISLWTNVSGTWTRNETNNSISLNVNDTKFEVNIPLGTYKWSCSATDDDNDEGFASTNRTINVENIIVNNIIYNPIVTATSNESFAVNLTYVTANWISANAVLNYNGTNYISTKTATTNNLIFNNTLIVPNPSVATNYSFFWNISLTNSSGNFYIITSSSNQTVNPLQIINITSLTCGAGFNSSFNFTSLIEANLSEINFTTVNYNLQYGSSGNSSALVSNGTFTDIPSFNICINSSSSYYVGYGEIQYQVSGYSARRFYIFLNTRITNTTVSNNLYSLETASSTPFQITATDTTLTAYVGYYIGLLRWYPELNTYKVVDMGKTDALGQTVLNVKTNDVDYRLALYSPDGTLVKLLDPIRMVCQTTPCIYSMIVDLTGVDLTTFLNIQSSLTFDTTTKIFTYIFNDPSQDTSLMNLTVWQDFPDRDSIIICSTTSNSFTGILVCDVSSYTGQLRAEVYRQASPPILIAQKLVDIRNSLMDVEGGKTMVLFIGLILTITMALMGVVSPPLVIILSLVALIPLIFLGLFSVALFVLIGAIGGIILHMLRRIS